MSARVDDDEYARAESVLHRFNAVDAKTRGEAYRASGWKGFDPAAALYTPDEVALERTRYY